MTPSFAHYVALRSGGPDNQALARCFDDAGRDPRQLVDARDSIESVIKNIPVRARSTVSGSVRSVQRSGRRGVGELLDSGGDTAPGVRAGVIAIRRELVGARGALLERLISVALQHQGGGTPDIDLGYHGGKIARLRSTNV